MSGHHLIEHIKAKPVRGAAQVEAESPLCWSREQVAKNVEQLHVLSRRGLWGVLLFLGVSAAALVVSQGNLLSGAQAELVQVIGPLPSADVLNVVLGVSWLSALVLILGRRGSDGRPGYSWYNVGLPAAFYPLYVFCDTTGSYFPVVFLAGLVLLLLEHGFVVCYTAKAIKEEAARLERLRD
ncbi:hypothetical protein [Geomonas subterranea]|uniref:Menaquinol oxidoreductase n=1 Tax=Geomonas subterranea TaxID=2847989 RepID=A0ABX8LBE6_9BACT|nr:MULTISPECIES: hypothetical protein [Geomonas]QXE89332.1 hypothetical protein KP001_12785 [Geomonas subterranea]QXM08553.1 hypothetical protein KP002_16485 [Geomonas subterranea]